MYIFFSIGRVYSAIFVTFAGKKLDWEMNRWIRRKRNSHGFGVQSPNDFYFVRHVLREKSPYYSYAKIHNLTESLSAGNPRWRETLCQLLFRLANYVHPEVVLEVGTGWGDTACSMALACVSCRCIMIEDSDRPRMEITPFLAELPQIETIRGELPAIFEKTVQETGKIEFLHVSQTPFYKEVVAFALSHVCNHSLFVIQGINDDPEKHAWWKSLQENPLTGVSYDLGSIGLLLFDTTRYKTAYWIDLKK